MDKISFSLITPLHNEEDVLERQLDLINNYLANLETINDYEILAIENGSTDKTLEILKTVSGRMPKLKYFSLEKRGLGNALRKGLENATCEACMFMSIDAGFGIDHIGACVEGFRNGNMLVLGSKNHPQSIYKAPLQRRIFSWVFNKLLTMLFGVKVTDSQGTFLIHKDLVNTILPKLKSDGSFFQTQLVIYSIRSNVLYEELPVVYDSSNHSSKIKTSDAITALKDMAVEFMRIHNIL